MTNNIVDVATFKSHDEAEAAIGTLQQSGFDLGTFSIAERDHDKYVVIAHGCSEEVNRAREIINRTNSLPLEAEQPLPDKGNVARWEHSLLP